MEPLTSRQEVILTAVVVTHVQTAQPVGSRAMAEKYHMAYSAATIRHDMGILEERCFLTHAHTSSGRLPTDLGYRYYLDHSLQLEEFSDSYFEGIEQELTESCVEFDEPGAVAEEVSRTLSRLAREMSLVLFSEPLSERGGRHPKVYLQGSANMLEKPEFQDVQKVRTLFGVLERSGELTGWLAKRPLKEREVTVSIGQENQDVALWDCAVVSTPYGSPGEAMGVLAILGPRRMAYWRTVPLAARMADIAGRVLGERPAGDGGA